MAKKSNTQINIEYAVARSTFFVFGLLPRRSAIRVCQWLMKGVAVFAAPLRKTAMRNLELAYPELNIQERKKILKGVFDNLGRVLGELSQFQKYTPERFAEVIDFELDEETLDLYRHVKEEGRGVLLTTGHFGNWEILVLGFAALHEPIHYLARPLDNPKIEKMLSDIRMRFGNIPINKTNSIMRAISVLNSGFGLGMLSDVNSHPKDGVFVPFFGIEACTPAGAAMIAIRANSYIYPVACIWDGPKKRYKFIHGKLLTPANTGDRKRDIIDTTAAYTSEIEAMIRRYPEQWMWTHKRWKTRPPGEDPLY